MTNELFFYRDSFSTFAGLNGFLVVVAYYFTIRFMKDLCLPWIQKVLGRSGVYPTVVLTLLKMNCTNIVEFG